jgi:hypothetical protein
MIESWLDKVEKVLTDCGKRNDDGDNKSHAGKPQDRF